MYATNINFSWSIANVVIWQTVPLNLKEPILMPTHLLCGIGGVPTPCDWSRLYFTQNHHRITHIADDGLVSHITHLWNWWTHKHIYIEQVICTLLEKCFMFSADKIIGSSACQASGSKARMSMKTRRCETQYLTFLKVIHDIFLIQARYLWYCRLTYLPNESLLWHFFLHH